MDINQLKQELLNASKGLMMLSETDEAFEFFYHEKPEEPFTEETVVEWDGKPAGTSVQVLALEDFLHRMKNPHPDADQVQKQNAERFRQLEAKLKELLKNVKAYKISETSIPVYIIGETANGDYAGLKTLVVET
ncbi:nuclease A inhibitor family protein [Pontibacter cellulosilyticus]|uniref:Nuclease A inhibitor family protein n=1 Tax=Pontibacter cellulosilyticus TaxID=1720253 RepID=A0A923N614_9BACT|nr:nuclease A inhibitor family protein [Pontibacter cellulosilyticus]MBC5991562.1 nuclease A inhibitor family protein [Pontibacter cellulosilyticus]